MGKGVEFGCQTLSARKRYKELQVQTKNIWLPAYQMFVMTLILFIFLFCFQHSDTLHSILFSIFDSLTTSKLTPRIASNTKTCIDKNIPTFFAIPHNVHIHSRKKIFTKMSSVNLSNFYSHVFD